MHKIKLLLWEEVSRRAHTKESPKTRRTTLIIISLVSLKIYVNGKITAQAYFYRYMHMYLQVIESNECYSHVHL